MNDVSASSAARLLLLYVDDERNNRIVMKHSLGEDFEVLVASSGDEALALLEANRPKVLLTDHRMPGMSGVELAERVRVSFPEVARLLLTAYAEDPSLTAALHGGVVQQVLIKPCERDVVVRAVLDAVK